MKKNKNLNESLEVNSRKRRLILHTRNFGGYYYYVLAMSPDGMITPYYEFIEADNYNAKGPDVYGEIRAIDHAKKLFFAQVGTLRIKVEIGLGLSMGDNKNDIDNLKRFLNNENVREILLSQIEFEDSLFDWEHSGHIGGGFEPKFNTLEALLKIQGLESFDLNIQDLAEELLKDGDKDRFMKNIISRLPDCGVKTYFPSASFFVNHWRIIIDVAPLDAPFDDRMGLGIWYSKRIDLKTKIQGGGS